MPLLSRTMREDAIVGDGRVHSNCDQRRCCRYETVNHHWPFTCGGAQHCAGHHSDFTAAKFTERLERRGGGTSGGRSHEHGNLVLEPNLIVTGASANAAFE